MNGEEGGSRAWSMELWERLAELLPGELSLSRLDARLANFLFSNSFSRQIARIREACRECASLFEELGSIVHRLFGRADHAYLALSLLVGARLAGRKEYEQVYSALGLPRRVGDRVILGSGPPGEPLMDPLAWARDLVSVLGREISIELRVGRNSVKVFTAKGLRVLVALGLIEAVEQALQPDALPVGVTARVELGEGARLLVTVKRDNTIAVFPERLPLTEHVKGSLSHIYKTLSKTVTEWNAESVAGRVFPTLSRFSVQAGPPVSIVLSATPFTWNKVTGVYAQLAYITESGGWLGLEVLSREADWKSGGVVVLEGRGDRFVRALRAVASALDQGLVENCGVSCIRLSVYAAAYTDVIASGLLLLTILTAKSGARENALGEAVAALLGEKHEDSVQNRLEGVLQTWKGFASILLPGDDVLASATPSAVVRALFEGLVYTPSGEELRELELSRKALLLWYADSTVRDDSSTLNRRAEEGVPESMLHALTALFSPAIYNVETARENPLLRHEMRVTQVTNDVLVRSPSPLPRVTVRPGAGTAHVTVGGLNLEVPVRALWALPRDSIEKLVRELLAELASELKYELPSWIRASAPGTTLRLSTLLASVSLEDVEGPEVLLYFDDAKRLAKRAAGWLPKAAGALPQILSSENLIAGLLGKRVLVGAGESLIVYEADTGITREPEPARAWMELEVPVAGLNVQGLPVKSVKIIFETPQSAAVNVELTIPREMSIPRWVVTRACKAVAVGKCNVWEEEEKGGFQVLVSVPSPQLDSYAPTVDSTLRRALEHFSQLLSAWRTAHDMLRRAVKRKYLYAWYALLVMKLAHLNHTDDEVSLALPMPPGKVESVLRKRLGATHPFLALARLLGDGRIMDDNGKVYIDGTPIEKLETILRVACEPCAWRDSVQVGMERARLLLRAVLAARSGKITGEDDYVRLATSLSKIAVDVVSGVSAEESVLILETLTRLWSAAMGLDGTIVVRGNRIMLRIGSQEFDVVGIAGDGRPVLLFRRGFTAFLFLMGDRRELAYQLAGRKELLRADRRRGVLLYAPAGQAAQVRGALLPLLDHVLSATVEERVEE